MYRLKCIVVPVLVLYKSVRKMKSTTQNAKIAAITEKTLIIGMASIVMCMVFVAVFADRESLKVIK